MVACGSSSSSSTSSTNSTSSNPKVFVDRVTQGLPYNCGTISGVTDSNGTFNTLPGLGCTFTLGKFSFTVSADKLNGKEVITPYDIGSNSSEALNLAYILHSVSVYDTDHSMKIDTALADKLPQLSLADSETVLDTKLFSAGISPRPMSMVKKDLDRFVKEDGSLVHNVEELKSSLSDTYTRKFPTIASMLNVKEKDFISYMGQDYVSAITGSYNGSSCGGYDINMENVKNMSLGSVINSSCSKFNISPILSLGALQANSMILNNQAGSSNEATISVAASQQATSHTDQMSLNFAASGRYMGYSGAASYHQENKYSDTHDSGSTYVGMTYSTQGAFVQLQTKTSGGSDYLNYSSYLLGNSLSESDISSYVAPIFKSYPTIEGNISYIGDINITNNGRISYSMGSVYYQNIQLLGAMETLFGQLSDQYTNPGTADANASAYIKAKTIALMLVLKESINDSIQAFYANAGESFVDTINVMNMAKGTGTLSFGSNTGNREAQYAATMSASYSGLFASGSVQASSSYNVQNGWADSFSKTSITANSYPAGVVDVNSWASTINTMLQAAKTATTLTVPGVTLQTQAALPTLTPPETKYPTTPPPTCFKSYQEWKDYQAGLVSSSTPAITPSTIDTSTSTDAQDEIEESGLPDSEDACNNFFKLKDRLSSDAYSQLKSELAELHSLKDSSLKASSKGIATNVSAMTSSDKLSLQSTSSNTITVDNMYVSGFSATPYSAVLPELRPNLTIPDVAQYLSGFPNVATLMTLAINYGKLDTYLNFISQFPVSGLNQNTVASSYHSAYMNFNTEVNNMISLSLKTGQDINASVAAAIVSNFISPNSNDETSLIKTLNGNTDAYNYITSLMSPDNQKVWMSAPGGYASIIYGVWPIGSGLPKPPAAMQIMMPKQVGDAGLAEFYPYEDTKFNDPSMDVLSIYVNVNSKYNANVSPLFPIFQYRQASSMELLFLQLAGAYQIIYANSFQVFPSVSQKSPSVEPVGNIDLSSLVPDVSLGGSVTTEGVSTTLLNDNSGIGFDERVWGYSLLWPSSTTTNSQQIRDKYEVLTTFSTYPLNINAPYTYSKFSGGYAISNSFMLNLTAENPFASAENWEYYLLQDTLSGVNGNALALMWEELSQPPANPPLVLLPINSTTSTMFAENPAAFSYTLPMSGSGYVHGEYFEDAYNNMLAR